MAEYKHNADTIAIRAWELRKSGRTEAETGKILLEELSREATGQTPEEIYNDVREAQELYAAHIFVQRHPEWLRIAEADENAVDTLEEQAREVNGGIFDLGSLEAVLYDGLEDGTFKMPQEPQPQPEPQTEGVQITPSGDTGTLTPTGSPEELARLRSMPLKDLKRLQAQQRWERLRATGRDRALSDEKVVI